MVRRLPAAGRRGETREVEFVGFGVATGAAKLESVKRPVTFPAAGQRLRLSPGDTLRRRAAVPAAAQRPARAALPRQREGPRACRRPSPACSTNGRRGRSFLRLEEGRGLVAVGGGRAARLAARRGPDRSSGPTARRSLATTTCPRRPTPASTFTVPADGTYQIVVSDMAGKSGDRAAIYRLVVQQPAGRLRACRRRPPARQRPVGGKFDLRVKAIAQGWLQGPDRPDRSRPARRRHRPPDLVIPAGKPTPGHAAEPPQMPPRRPASSPWKGPRQVAASKCGDGNVFAPA